ncbi:MAG TPA: hypothetical protein VLB84_13140 [Bacteroidia bacterium]|nr:hypothetical protein [Bacteroidia bacterium]
MKYLIIDWMNNVCFDTENENLTDFDETSEFLDEAILKESPNLEACENKECCCQALGHECDSLEVERGEYIIQEYNEETDRIMWNGQRYVLKKDYYKGV